jgi:hypothetical protein
MKRSEEEARGEAAFAALVASGERILLDAGWTQATCAGRLEPMISRHGGIIKVRAFDAQSVPHSAAFDSEPDLAAFIAEVGTKPRKRPAPSDALALDQALEESIEANPDRFDDDAPADPDADLAAENERLRARLAELEASPPPSQAVVALEGMGRDPIQFVRDDTLIAPTSVEIDIRGESYTFSHKDALAFVGAFTVTLAREPAVLKLASGQTVTVTIDDIEHIGRQLTEKGLQ